MPDKPRKPYKSFPLTPHVRGGWAKKYKGRQLYFANPDPDAALKAFHRAAKQIDHGEPITLKAKPPQDATVYDVTNRYVVERQADRDAETLSDGAWRDYRDAANWMCDAFGDDKLVVDLTPDDFTRLYRELAARLGTHALARAVQSCRTIWKHAEDNDWIHRRPRYGSVFKKPTADKKQGSGFTIDEARILIACAVGSQIEAMLLLMLNGGYTAKDCADLPVAAADFKRGIIVFPRPKMRRRRAIDRVMTLWPETAEALAEVIAKRPDDRLVFRTLHGNPWVQGQTDSVAQEFSKIVDALGWNPKPKDGKRANRGPAWLRHLHRTIADELEKPHAAARLMGHRLPGLADTYVDRVEHHRIQQITDYIRSKLWPRAAPTRPEPS